MQSLGKEFTRYQASTEDDEDWWKKVDAWKGAQALSEQRAAMQKEIEELNASQKEIAKLPPQEDTALDIEMRAKAKAEDAEATARALRIASGATTLDDIF